jgi:heterodisulfide reductase subunit A
MVVLATAIMPRKGIKELAQLLKIDLNEHGFINEAHSKLRPVESLSQGIFLCGCAQAPKDIPDSVSQAGAAAAKVGELLSREKLEQEPTIVGADSDLCCGCTMCISVCPHNARALDPEERKAVVHEALCKNCGSCVASCPTGAAQQCNHTDDQVMSKVKVLIED